MFDLESMDRVVMSALGGLDTFDATFYADDLAAGVECQVMRDTLELENEYGVTAIQSGAAIHYLRADVTPALGSWWEFDGRRYVVENKIPSQDSSWRIAHCRVEPLP